MMNRLDILAGLFGACALCLAGAACGDDAGPDPTVSSSGSGASGSTNASQTSGPTSATSTGTGGMGPTCMAPGYPGADVDTNVGVVQGQILDEAGEAADDILADVCGTNLCLSAETDTGGNFSTDGGQATLTDVRFIYGNGLRFVKMAAPYTADGSGNFDFSVINTVALPAFSAGAAMSAGASVTNGTATLEIEAGAAINHDILLYLTEDERTFRSVVFPATGNFPAIDAGPDFDMVIGLAPINTQICPAAKLTVANDAGLAANTEVEFWFHGTKIFTDYAGYGGWAKVSDGVVTSDGASIVTNDGEGIPELGVIGIAAK